jgi:hypothetical protein
VGTGKAGGMVILVGLPGVLEPPQGVCVVMTLVGTGCWSVVGAHQEMLSG